MIISSEQEASLLKINNGVIKYEEKASYPPLWAAADDVNVHKCKVSVTMKKSEDAFYMADDLQVLPVDINTVF